MNKKLIASSALTILLCLPAVVLAVALIPPPLILGSYNSIFDAIFNLLWPIFGAYAIIMFMIAGFTFLSAQGEAGKVKDARNAVVWGSAGVALGILAFSIPFIIKFALGV